MSELAKWIGLALICVRGSGACAAEQEVGSVVPPVTASAPLSMALVGKEVEPSAEPPAAAEDAPKSCATEESLPVIVPAHPVVGHMAPYPEERLAKPIDLEDCDGVTLIEWRPSASRRASTGPSHQAIGIVAATCRRAVVAFDHFVEHDRHIQLAPVERPIRVSVSLLPFAKDEDGTDYRSLNDVVHRFAFRGTRYRDDGSVAEFWGLTMQKELSIYMRNDVLTEDCVANRSFKMVFAHGFFHVFSYARGVWARHAGNKTKAEEAMARRFTWYLGLGD